MFTHGGVWSITLWCQDFKRRLCVVLCRSEGCCAWLKWYFATFSFAITRRINLWKHYKFTSSPGELLNVREVWDLCSWLTYRLFAVYSVCWSLSSIFKPLYMTRLQLNLSYVSSTPISLVCCSSASINLLFNLLSSLAGPSPVSSLCAHRIVCIWPFHFSLSPLPAFIVMHELDGVSRSNWLVSH